MILQQCISYAIFSELDLVWVFESDLGDPWELSSETLVILDLDGFKIEFTTVDFSIIRLFKYIAVINSANKSLFYAIQKQKYFQCNPRSVKKDRHNQGPSDDGTASFRGRP